MKKKPTKIKIRVALAIDSEGAVSLNPHVETNARIGNEVLVDSIGDIQDLSAIRSAFIIELTLPVPKGPKVIKRNPGKAIDVSEMPPDQEDLIGVGNDTP